MFWCNLASGGIEANNGKYPIFKSFSDISLIGFIKEGYKLAESDFILGVSMIMVSQIDQFLLGYII